MFSIDQVGKIEDAVEEVLIQERMRYAEIYKCIELYISAWVGTNEKEIYLGGTQGINLLFDRPRDLECYTYTLYSAAALVHANNLTNAIAETQNYDKGGFVVTLLNKLPYRVYDISVDNRSIVTLYQLSGQNLAKLILPIKTKSYGGYTVSILSPEVYLMEAYHILCSPNAVSEWFYTLRNEVKLYQLMKHRLDTVFSNVLVEGGAVEMAIEQKILTGIVNNNPGVVLIGEHAIRVIHDNEHLALPLDWKPSRIVTVIGDAREIYESVKKISPHATMTERPVPILEDFRLSRSVIKIDDKEAMYIYNSCTYDCIPYNLRVAKDKSSIRLGSPFLIIRFLLIELWVIRWIHTLGSIDTNFAKKRIESIIKLIVALRNKMTDENINIQTMSYTRDVIADTKVPIKLITNLKDELFDHKYESTLAVLGKNYMGTYISEYIAVKVQLQNSDKKFPPYHPQRYYKEHGAYRVLGDYKKAVDRDPKSPKEDPETKK